MALHFDQFKQQILDAAQASDFSKFSKLAANYSSFMNRWKELCTKSGDTVVHLSAHSGCVDVIKYYAEQGNKLILEHRNLDGKTPLHVAAHSGQLKCVQYLLHCNVVVNALKRADWTPLMLACTKPNLEIIKELLLHGANLDIVNKDGWTAFHIASREGNLDVIQFLLQSHPLVWNTTSNNGRTPLHTASLHGHLNTVKLFLTAAHYNLNVKDACGTTPLMDAASGNHNDVLKYLIAEGALVDEVDKLGRNVLHLAAETGNLDSIQCLVNNCYININSQTPQGLTPLHFACKENNIESVKLLVHLGADISITDKRSRTALEYSRKADVHSCLQAFLQK